MMMELCQKQKQKQKEGNGIYENGKADGPRENAGKRTNRS
jgi:hypothetical protein